MGITVMDENDKDKISQVIKEVLLKFDNVDLGYIFGSLLDELNVAVVTSERLQPYDGRKFATKLTNFIKKSLGHNCRVNVKILQLSPVSVQYDIIRKGKLIFCKSNLRRVMYEMDVISKCSNY
ncbi:MAG: nucleotidyltransferase domain-containing protein [Candidatus Jordarchaeales archaeon]|nr:hypothetical protein [Candidatus Jordarchaeia archaeon]